MSDEPELGSPAPDFALPAHTDREVRLAELRGKKVALLFYVFDFSPGWTHELTSFREVYDKVREADAELLGISGDHIWAHKAYAEKLGELPFPLLADWGMRVVRLYGVHNPERDVPKRAVFVIDRDGVVRFKNTAFDARDPGHYAEVLDKLAELP